MSKETKFVNWLNAIIVLTDEYGDYADIIRPGEEYIIAEIVSDLHEHLPARLWMQVPVYERQITATIVNAKTLERRPFTGLPEYKEGVYHILPFAMRFHPHIVQRSQLHGDVLFLNEPDIDGDGIDLVIKSHGLERVWPAVRKEENK